MKVVTPGKKMVELFDCKHCEATLEVEPTDFIRSPGYRFWAYIVCPECGRHTSFYLYNARGSFWEMVKEHVWRNMRY